MDRTADGRGRRIGTRGNPGAKMDAGSATRSCTTLSSAIRTRTSFGGAPLRLAADAPTSPPATSASTIAPAARSCAACIRRPWSGADRPGGGVHPGRRSAHRAADEVNAPRRIGTKRRDLLGIASACLACSSADRPRRFSKARRSRAGSAAAGPGADSRRRGGMITRTGSSRRFQSSVVLGPVVGTQAFQTRTRRSTGILAARATSSR